MDISKKKEAPKPPSKEAPQPPPKREKPITEVQTWKTPGNRTITYNSKDKTVQIDDGLPFPIISMDRRFAPERIYIQETRDTGIYAGKTENSNITLYRCKYQPEDEPVIHMSQFDRVLQFNKKNEPIITGQNNIYNLEDGTYMYKGDNQEKRKPLQTKKL